MRSSTSGKIPLIAAAASSYPEIVSKLFEAGAEPDIQDIYIYNALPYATIANRLESMELLLRYKTDVDNETLHIAARQRAKEATFSARREREQREFDDQQKRARLVAQKEKKRLKKKGDIRVAHSLTNSLINLYNYRS